MKPKPREHQTAPSFARHIFCQTDARWRRSTRLTSPRRAELGVGAAELAAVQQKFAAFDADGSGAIDVDELALLLAEMGGAYSPAEVRLILAQIDADKSGVIEFVEFLRWWAGGSDGAPAPAPAPPPARRRRTAPPSPPSGDRPVLVLSHNSPDAIVQRVFDAADRDHNGIHRPARVRRAAHAARHPGGADADEDEAAPTTSCTRPTRTATR